jgi:GNAT superfamily N-acetyltransferase
MLVREMVLADCSAVASIHVRGWQATYRGIMPDEFLNALSIEQRTERWQGNLARSNSLNLVAEEAGKILAFGGGAQNRTPDLVKDAPFELWALYADPDHWKQGAGFQLFSDFARRIGGAFVIWVARDNHIGRRFYERVGCRLQTATKDEEVGGVQVPHVAYVYP